MRLPSGGLIDRSRRLRFQFDGREFEGHPGDTLASALLANGVMLVGRSFKYHRPRGIMAAGIEEPNAIVRLGEGSAAEPNLKATEVPLADGLVATSVNCWPSPRFDLRSVNQLAAPLLTAGFYYKTFIWPAWRLFEGPIRRAAGLATAPAGRDPDHYIHAHARCGVLVVGGGPAGLRAALDAARAGRTVTLVEADVQLGGSALWREDGSETAQLAALLYAHPDTTILTRTSLFGYYDHNMLAAVETLDGNGARQRIWHIRADEVILATGAIERPLVFEGNDRPGVMLASAAHAYVRRFAVLPGRRIVLFTNNDGAYEAGTVLAAAGAEVTVIDAREGSETGGESLTVLTGTRIRRTRGSRRVCGVDLCDRDGRPAGKLACDLLLMSGGWSPAVHLFSQAGGRLCFDDERQCFVPDTADQKVRCIGGAAGDLGALGVGRLSEPPESAGKAFVDFANDVTARDVATAAHENYVSVEHLKRYTTLGMGIDQGKTSNINGLALMGSLTGRTPKEVGTTKFRPPYTPVRFGALAGPEVGPLYKPLRRLPAYDWHTAQGALMEEYGDWVRPTAYPASGETWEAAAQREARAARETAALFDGSPLGKIEIAGPDAGAFLDRVYVGTASTLRPGRARYGIMLNENGIVIDDGVFVRFAEDRFLLHATSGGAARVAAMLDEWLQCEWPDLDVVMLDVSAQWATLTLSGPRSRAILADAGTDMDLDTFPHMTWRQGQVAELPARILRASFTGEASYEISVPARRARQLADALASAGAEHGLVPIGIEALMILRIEKGYLHVGVDTDGTTLPDDIGMAGGIAKKTSDFIGRRSLLQPDAQRPDRPQLVGLLSEGAKLPVGAHILRAGRVPGPIDGHVTSSVHSPALDRPIALGLVHGGRARIGETVDLYDLGARYRAAIVDPVFFDKTGERLRG